MEYQYYEFAAIDQPLNNKDRDDLREISSRATISATSFVNHYEYGSLKADPIALMKKYFDLFVYVANFGTHTFAMRIPKSVWNDLNVGCFAIDDDVMKVYEAEANVVLCMKNNEEDGFQKWNDAGTWMAKLAPLRSSLIVGNLDLLYALWLAMVDKDRIRDETKEPIPGIIECSESLIALANFLNFDPCLMLASVRKHPTFEPDATAIRTFISGLTENEKVNFLEQMYVGDNPHIGAKLRRLYKNSAHSTYELRSAGELRRLAKTIRDDSEHLAQAKAKADKQQRDKEKAEVRRKHLDTLAARGDEVWLEVEKLIDSRNAQGYDKAATILGDLAEIAVKNGTTKVVVERFTAIRKKHSSKRKFIERLNKGLWDFVLTQTVL